MRRTFLITASKFLLIFLLLTSYSFSLDKFFIGLNVGRTFSDAQINHELPIKINRSSKLGDDDFIVGGFLGYNNSIEDTPLFVGFELGGNYHHMVLSKEEQAFPPFAHHVTNIKTNASILGALKFGLIVKDLLFYVKGGAAWTNWSFKFSDRTTHAWKEKTIYSQKTGVLMGCGLDYVLNKNWLLGIEYINSSYPELRLNPHVGKMKASPTIHNCMLRLIYAL